MSLSFRGKLIELSLFIKCYWDVCAACWRCGQPAPYVHLARTFDLVGGQKGKIKATSMLCNMFRRLVLIVSYYLHIFLGCGIKVYVALLITTCWPFFLYFFFQPVCWPCPQRMCFLLCICPPTKLMLTMKILLVHFTSSPVLIFLFAVSHSNWFLLAISKRYFFFPQIELLYIT